LVRKEPIHEFWRGKEIGVVRYAELVYFRPRRKPLGGKVEGECRWGWMGGERKKKVGQEQGEERDQNRGIIPMGGRLKMRGGGSSGL